MPFSFLIWPLLIQLTCLMFFVVFFLSDNLGDLNKIRNVTDLLNDMVYALNPSDGGYCSMQLTILHHHTGDLSDREPNY